MPSFWVLSLRSDRQEELLCDGQEGLRSDRQEGLRGDGQEGLITSRFSNGSNLFTRRIVATILAALSIEHLS